MTKPHFNSEFYTPVPSDAMFDDRVVMDAGEPIMESDEFGDEDTFRQFALCKLIQDLRTAKNWNPLNPSLLSEYARNWDTVLFEVPTEDIESREEGSIAVAAIRGGCSEAGEVIALWQASQGRVLRSSPQAQEAAVLWEAQQEKRLYSQSAQRAAEDARFEKTKPEGPGRKRLQEFLRARGFGEAELKARCA